MLKPRSPQASFYGSYLYDRIVPQDHLLRKINAVVDFSFIRELVKDRYTPDFGRPAEDPEFMLRLCLLQYIYGDSDREVVANARYNLAYKYFLGLAIDAEVPDDSTICCFRVQRLGEEKFRAIFQQIVQQCIDQGMVTGKRQIIDSTHIEADVTRNSLSAVVRLCRRNVIQDLKKQNPNVSHKLAVNEPDFNKQDRFTRLEEGLEEEVEEAKKLLDAVTTEFKEGTLRATPELTRSLELLEKAVADREDKAKDRLVSPIDPDARAGRKTSKSWVGYKGHFLLEEDSEIITAIDTTPANQTDGQQLKSLLKQQEKELSLQPEELSGDKGYDSGANLEYLEVKGITGNISLSSKGNNKGEDLFGKEDFIYDNVKNTVTCPAGHTVSHYKRDVHNQPEQYRKGILFEFPHRLCSICELKALCHPGESKVHGRAVHISYYLPLYQQMKQRMESEEGRSAYKKRYRVEHKVADLARYCHLRHCRYRGLARAKIHTLLAAIVSNVKRMARLLCQNTDMPPKMLAVAP